MTQEFEDIRYEVDGPAAVVTIARPERYNAFRGADRRGADRGVPGGVGRPVGSARSSSPARATRRSAAAATSSSAPRPATTARPKSGLFEVDYLHKLIRDIPKPVIAAVNGVAIGGGHVLHVLCDLTIASETARFGQAGPRVGSFDAGFGTAYLARVVGEKRAREIWFLCRQYDAVTAERWGLVNAVVAPDEVLPEAKRWAGEVAHMSPTAIRFLKHSFNADTDHQGGIGNMAAAGLDLFVESDEGREGAARVHREACPRLRAVRPMSVTLDLSDRIAVVTGAASGIGRAIALTLADAGATVAAVDRNEAGVRETIAELGGAGTPHVADLTDPGGDHGRCGTRSCARTGPRTCSSMPPGGTGSSRSWTTTTSCGGT